MASRRCWHILKRNENTESVHQAIWWDTETDPVQIQPDMIEHRLKFGYACYRKVNRHGNWSRPEWYRFTSPGEFWDWVIAHTRPKTRLFLFDHNTNFDVPVVHTLTELPGRDWRLDEAIIDGPPTMLTYLYCQLCAAEGIRDRAICRKYHGSIPKRTIKLIDTVNIWAMKLETLGAQIGLPKLKMPAAEDPPELWEAYGKRDVEIIMKATIDWLQWLKTYDMGGFAPTLASQALRAYRHRFMDHEVLIDNHEQALQLCRDAYHGGRVECGRLGKFAGRFFLLDVNSMYPYVMREHPMPTKLRGFLTRCEGLDLRGYLHTFSCVGECSLDTDVPFAAVVRDDKLIFPIGRFKAYLSTPELEYGLQLGAIRAVHSLAIYDRAPLFQRVVDDIYEHRAQRISVGDEVGAWHFKRLLNSLYGKWGQNGRKWKTIGTCDPSLLECECFIDAQTKATGKIRKFGGLVQVLQVDGESFESHPAIAAHICAYARLYLFEIIRQCGAENYFYCDTDSVLVNFEGFERLKDRIDRVRLGGLKQVGEYRDIEIYGPKDYVLDGKVTLKGIRPSARQIDDRTYVQERWSSLKGLIRENSVDAPRTRMITKRLSRTYSKGVTDGTSHVYPFMLDEL